MSRRTYGYGVCPACRRVRSVGPTGAMQSHGRLSPAGHTMQRSCPGVDQPMAAPAERPADHRARLAVHPIEGSPIRMEVWRGWRAECCA